MIENRQKAGRDRALPAAGLAIWHVDEVGGNSHEQMTSGLHYERSLMQADGALNLENGDNDGDATDLFHFGGNFHFGGTTNPGSGWWDGYASNLEIRDIRPGRPGHDIQGGHRNAQQGFRPRASGFL